MENNKGTICVQGGWKPTKLNHYTQMGVTKCFLSFPKLPVHHQLPVFLP